MKTFKQYFNQNVLIESVSEAEALKYKSAEEFVKARQVPDARIPDSFEFSSPNASKYYYGNKTQQFLEKARTERVSEITMPKDSIVHRGESKYSKHFKAKQRLTDIWNKAQRNNI